MLTSIKRKLVRRLVQFIKYYEKEPMQDMIARYRGMGISIGNSVALYDTKLDPLYPWLVTIGNNCTLSGVEILTHDDSHLMYTQKRRVAPVFIGDNVFMGRGTIVLPGVTIGSNVVIGAGSVVTRDIPDGSVAAGNPARVMCQLEDFLARKVNADDLIPYVFYSNIVDGATDREASKIVASMFHKQVPNP